MTNENAHEEMASFFDQRAEGYDAHMQRSLADADTYYRKLAEPIKPTQASLAILDIGCGTGLEIAAVLDVAPNAHLTCVDLSADMLDKLKEKYPRDSVETIQASYLALDFGEARYDAALSSMTLHHLLPNEKLPLYRRLLAGLRPGSLYIEGDYIVSPAKMDRFLAQYRSLPPQMKQGRYHVDIPLSLAVQTSLLEKAGFIKIHTIYEQGETLILTAQKPPEGHPHENL